jgi:peptide-methionine (R)-S-oxide reductase
MKKIIKTDEQWQQSLTEPQFNVLRKGATEAPGSGEYYHLTENGDYLCAACGHKVFDSASKYDSGSGWPSFYQAADKEAVMEHDDSSHGMDRVEIKCARCESHLGHVFPDGPNPTGLRYCINSVSLKFSKK